jgi:hypothetical protein
MEATVTGLKCNLLPCNKHFSNSLGAYFCGKHLVGPVSKLEPAEEHFINVLQFYVVTFVMSICSEIKISYNFEN